MRDILTPEGNEDFPAVRRSNKMTSRMVCFKTNAPVTWMCMAFRYWFQVGILEPSCSTHITYHWFSQRLPPEDRDLDVDNNTFRWCLLHGKSPQQFGGHAPSVHMDGRKAERIWDPSCPANLWFEFCISPNGTVSKKRVPQTCKISFNLLRFRAPILWIHSQICLCFLNLSLFQ